MDHRQQRQLRFVHPGDVGIELGAEISRNDFQQDLNGDGLIGNSNVVIELAGSTSLTQVGSSYYLYNSGAVRS